MSIPGPGPVQVCPVVDGRTRGDLWSSGRRGGDGESLARRLPVAGLGGDHAEVVLDLGVAGQLRGAVLEEGQRALDEGALLGPQGFRGMARPLPRGATARRASRRSVPRTTHVKVLETKIEVTEGGADLKLGMTVDVRILTLYKERAVVIPKRLVPPGATEATLRVAGGGPPEPRLVKLGLRGDARVEGLAGLREDEQVVVPAAPSR